jgi:peptidoglycan-associated lipoprotein
MEAYFREPTRPVKKDSKMKLNCFAKPIVLGLLVAAVFAGCKSPVGVTPIPGQKARNPNELAGNGALTGNDNPIGTNDLTGGIPLPDPSLFENMTEDPAALAAYTVHFDFDSSVVKSSEESKLTSVAGELKGRAGNAVRIAGHCDERGTEEYNRSLGNRRALALREKLLVLGIDPKRIDTRSYGEDMPVDHGHNEAAYAKNRRGEFILLVPK